MTGRSYGFLGVRRHALPITFCLLALPACNERPAPSVAQTWEEVCVDADADGYGFQCAAGEDCDDVDPALHDGCNACRKPAEGCACDEATAPIDCALPLSIDAQGALICRSGTRYCRDGHWSACEGVATFTVASPAGTLASRALVDPDAPPRPCEYPCHPGCFRIEDTMVTPPNYMLPSGLAVGSEGGITLSRDSPAGSVPPFDGLLDEAPCADDDMPDCDGLPMPFDPDPDRDPSGSAHRTVFFELSPGESRTQRLATRVFLSSADVYFYLDATSTMSDELTRLIADFRTGNFLPDDGVGFDCVDANFDGAPDNEKKVQGIAGNIACLVRDARFGAGWFREIPFYGPYAATDQLVAAWDSEMFEHRHDISPDITSVANVLTTFSTRANLNVPEGGMQGLWALATGGEIYAGWDRPGVPERRGCPASTFGYACFREEALPIVLHFTDAPMQEGPSTRARSSAETNPPTPANCLGDAYYHDGNLLCDPLHYDDAVLSGLRAGSEGHYRALTSSAEDRARAEPVGAIDDVLVTYVGSTERMSSEMTYGNLDHLCPRDNAWSPVDQTSPDAAFRFRVNTAGTYLLSGRGTHFDATFMLFALDPAGAITRALACSDTAVHLSQAGELDYAPEIEAALMPGEYLLVLKGYRSASRGPFQVSFGLRSREIAGSFQAKRWLGPRDDGSEGVREALVARALRVITIQSGSDPYVEEQATALAAATQASANGVALRGAIGTDVRLLGDEVVRVVRELALGTQMDVSLSLREAPDRPLPSFGLQVEALDTLGDGCAGVSDSDGDLVADTHLDCGALAQPQFNVTFRNGVDASAVPRNPNDAQGGYHMLLRVLGDGRYLLDQIPVYLLPTAATEEPVTPLHSASGDYDQVVAANGCGEGEGPLWLSLAFDTTLPPDTALAFEMCGADSDAALETCTFTELASVVRGGACIEQTDCGSDGYCESGFCHLVTGATCDDDAQCGAFGTCTNRESRSVCTYARATIDLRQIAPQLHGRPLARVRARLSASPDRTQAPTLTRWTLEYSCTRLE